MEVAPTAEIPIEAKPGKVAGFFRNSAEYLRAKWAYAGRFAAGAAAAGIFTTVVIGSIYELPSLLKLPQQHVATLSIVYLVSASVALGISAALTHYARTGRNN